MPRRRLKGLRIWLLQLDDGDIALVAVFVFVLEKKKKISFTWRPKSGHRSRQLDHKQPKVHPGAARPPALRAESEVAAFKLVALGARRAPEVAPRAGGLRLGTRTRTS